MEYFSEAQCFAPNHSNERKTIQFLPRCDEEEFSESSSITCERTPIDIASPLIALRQPPARWDASRSGPELGPACDSFSSFPTQREPESHIPRPVPSALPSPRLRLVAGPRLRVQPRHYRQNPQHNVLVDPSKKIILSDSSIDFSAEGFHFTCPG
jgi:hypothetical protein